MRRPHHLRRRVIAPFMAAFIAAPVVLAPSMAMADEVNPEPPDTVVAPEPAPPTGESLDDLTIDGEKVFWLDDTLIQPFAEVCTPGKAVVLTNTKNTMDVAYATSVMNDTSRTVGYKFTAKKTKTTTWSVSASVTAEAKAAIFAKVEASLNGGITKSNQTEYGAEVTGKVPPKTRTYGDYGNWKENAKFKVAQRYSNCTYSTWKYGTFSAPYREAWRVWES